MNIVKSIYNLFRRFLPTKIGVYYNVPTRDPRLFDMSDYDPRRKQVFLDLVERNSRPGHRVLIYGGGRGIAAVVAARRVLPTGAVTVYEIAAEQLDRTRRAVEFNGLDEYVTIRHALVGPGVDVWGDDDGALSISPNSITESDVWAVDIEGGELGLLERALEQEVIWPNVMIILSHPGAGSSPSKLWDLLVEAGVFDDVRVRSASSSTGMSGDVVIARRRKNVS